MSVIFRCSADARSRAYRKRRKRDIVFIIKLLLESKIRNKNHQIKLVKITSIYRGWP